MGDLKTTIPAILTAVFVILRSLGLNIEIELEDSIFNLVDGIIAVLIVIFGWNAADKPKKKKDGS